jgi:hypothetical protein
MTTMKLDSLVSYLTNELNMPTTAECLRLAETRIIVIDGDTMIDADFVKRNLTTEIWRQVGANVTSYVWM